MTVFDSALLRSFLAVERTGGFTAAAKQLGLRQSTVSGHIAKLELAVGRELFLRDTHRVDLTPDGSAMLGFARSILAAQEQAQRYFSGGELTGRLRFGASEDVVAMELPRVLREFRAHHPSVDLELAVGRSETLHRRLRANQLDLVLVKRRPGERHGTPVYRDRLVWAGPEGARAEVPDPVPLVTYPDPSLTREAALRALENAGLGHRLTCVADSQQGLRAGVLAGLGFIVHAETLLPPGLAPIGPAAGLPDPGSLEFVLVNRPREPSPQEQALADAIKQNSFRLRAGRPVRGDW
ncbi:LysR family transcriptional regulator [Amycolatopsis minnesotensis]|uniref:LysR family transcriptional regulator n=1 Tax=Amycolatopsis minnesotensis TaxID=337894 RepID=A0ABP5C1W5_9PSEU